MGSRSVGPTKAWVVVASLLVCAQLVLALSMKPSYPLTAFGDASQCILLLVALLSVIPIAFHPDGRTRLFGWLMVSASYCGSQRRSCGHTLKFIDANKFRTHF